MITEAWLQEHIFPRFSRVLAREEVYLANHSLGRPPDRAADDVAGAMARWYADLDDAWGDWIGARERFRGLIAGLIGAPRPDTIVPKANAGQGLRAVLNAADRPLRILTTRSEFDSIDFILKVYASRGRAHVDYVDSEAVEDVIAALRPDHDLVVISLVMFQSGRVLTGWEDLVHAAHARGARVVLDVYHAVGTLPFAVGEVDYAIGGCYKYLRGGPGAGWLYVRPDHLRGMVTLDTGWFAKRDPMGYERPDVPAFGEGGDALLESTPAILLYYQALAGIEVVAEIGVDRLRAYSLEQQRVLIGALARHGIAAEGGRPDRGAFVVVRDPDAVGLARRLKAAGVNADARGEALRLCPDMLNTTRELHVAADRLAAVR